MARQVLNKKKTLRIAQETNLPVEQVFVRGNTEHRKDLCLSDGRVVSLFKDGDIVDFGSRWKF